MPEVALTFSCRSEALVGVLHIPEGACKEVGVVFVVGGPQYRVGSHRQFVLMARRFADAGFPVIRFDYRGMGDSSGDSLSFKGVDDDICAAIDVVGGAGLSLRGVVIFGLCDAASAALMYCSGDRRVLGLLLANPWVRTEVGEARTLVSQYFLKRVLDVSFWRKLLTGQVAVKRSFNDLVGAVGRAFGAESMGGTSEDETDFVPKMLKGWRQFKGRTLILQSENDLTAREFEQLCRTDLGWREQIASGRVDVRAVEGADHTFSGRPTLDRAVDLALSWLNRIAAA